MDSTDMNARTCRCVVKNREEGESEREWFKRWMCQYHWMQTDYYRAKLAWVHEPASKEIYKDVEELVKLLEQAKKK